MPVAVKKLKPGSTACVADFLAEAKKKQKHGFDFCRLFRPN